MSDSVQKEIKHRLRRPFFASLVIAFVIVNWKTVMMALFPESGYGIQERITDIEAFYVDQDKYFKMIYYWPVGIALGAVTILAVAVYFLEWIPNKIQEWRVADEQRLDDIKHRRQEMIDGLSQRINKLEDDLQHKDREIGQAENQLDKEKEKWRNHILQMIQTYPNFKKIIEALHLGRQKMDHSNDLSFLQGIGLITHYKDGVYQLTDEGETLAKY